MPLGTKTHLSEETSAGSAMQRRVEPEIATAVKERIAVLKRSCLELQVEQYLLLTGRIWRSTASVLGFIDPNDIFGPALLISGNRLTRDEGELAFRLAFMLSDRNSRAPSGLRRRRAVELIVRLYDCLNTFALKRLAARIGADYFVSTRDGIIRVASRDLHRLNSRHICYPRGILNEETLSTRGATTLSKQGCIGMYHVHPQDEEPLPGRFSREDYAASFLFKRSLRVRRLLVGVGDRDGDVFELV